MFFKIFKLDFNLSKKAASLKSIFTESKTETNVANSLEETCEEMLQPCVGESIYIHTFHISIWRIIKILHVTILMDFFKAFTITCGVSFLLRSVSPANKRYHFCKVRRSRNLKSVSSIFALVCLWRDAYNC